MKQYATCLLVLTVTVLCGCLPSLQPFYTEAGKTELPWVEGKWLQLDKDGTLKADRPWVFKGKVIYAVDEKGRRATLEANYFSVNKINFVDTAVDSELPGSTWITMHLLPVHQLAKVERFGDRLVLTPMDFEWVTKAVKSGEVTLRHELLDDSVVFTCSPEDWERFLAEHGANTNLFSGEVRYNFSKVAPEAPAGEAPPVEGKPAE